MKSDQDLRKELESFQTLWQGGYFEGDPLDPTFGLYGLNAFLGVSRVIYVSCIRPYVGSETRVLEIGCGRGAWTKVMLHGKEVHCLDALSAEHNRFYEYVGRHPHVHYHHVSDFSMGMLADASMDYTFSNDSLCHVSFDGISRYACSLARVMRPGGHGFWMVADYRKYNRFMQELDRTNVLNCLLPRQNHPWCRRILAGLFRAIGAWNARRYDLHRLDPNEDDKPRPGRWYHAGTEETCRLLQDCGFRVLDEDMGIDHRSPMIHFQR